MQVLSIVWQHTMQRQTVDQMRKGEPMPAQRQSARQGHVYKHERKTSSNRRSSGISNAWSTGAAAETVEAVAKGRVKPVAAVPGSASSTGRKNAR